MPRRHISLKECELAHQRLRWIAEERSKRFLPRFLSLLGKETFWHYYLKFGYFKEYGNTMRTVSLNGKSCKWWGYPYAYYENTERALAANEVKYNGTTIPLGLGTLFNEAMKTIYPKKYGNLPV